MTSNHLIHRLRASQGGGSHVEINGEYVAIGDVRQDAIAEIERLRAALNEAVQLLRDGQDADYNEVMECEDVSWMTRANDFLQRYPVEEPLK